MPKQGLSLPEATRWFSEMWNIADVTDMKSASGKKLIDSDLVACLVFLTRSKKPGSSTTNISGFLKLKTPELLGLHTPDRDTYFAEDINKSLRSNKIVIVGPLSGFS